MIQPINHLWWNMIVIYNIHRMSLIARLSSYKFIFVFWTLIKSKLQLLGLFKSWYVCANLYGTCFWTTVFIQLRLRCFWRRKCASTTDRTRWIWGNRVYYKLATTLRKILSNFISFIEPSKRPKIILIIKKFLK